MDPEQYCRDIEAFLCRKNDGHLIRIVGPSFERVCDWAARGVPFKIACHGIDRYFERYYAKGPRRRPVQIDFCEADVLDAFDAWRRALGLRLSAVAEQPGSFDASGEDTPEEARARRHRPGLATHLGRVIMHLAARRAEPSVTESFGQILERAADGVIALTRVSSPVRGDARVRTLSRLEELDGAMMRAVREQCGPAALCALRQEAAEQLVPFRDRMMVEAYERSLEAAVDRLIRERERLPTLTLE